ncbi:MAG: nucleotidyltransferase family protein [Candidatus Aenigmarchaeota archaeon]|nr:nucleotidyltransferase family protein [Candidatus Aenigmarchaeota archaeon]
MKNNKKNIEKLRKKIIPILKRYGVVKAGLFGSFVRGEATRKSDIDILIQFRGRKSLLDLVGLEIELEKKLKRKADVLTYNSIHPLLKDRILDEEVRIL